MRTASGKRILLCASLAAAMVVGALSPSFAFLDKTRFVAHLGVAYFAFHHWVMKPYEQGAFADGAPHRTAAMVKGGVALLFAVHEVRVAQKVAQNSKDPLLQKMNGAMTNLMATFTSAGQKLKGGQFAAGDLDALKNQTTTLGSLATQAGAVIKDVPVAIPGT